MDFFSEEQTYALLTEIGVHVVSDGGVNWLGLCPFHNNTHTPAFAVNKENGLFLCFNNACGAKGNMESLIRQVKGVNPFAAMRMIARAKKNSPVSLPKMLEKTMADEPMPEFSQSTLDGMEEHYWRSPEAQEYMAGRGFTPETMKHYHIGYSPKNRMVGVPMYNVMGRPVGLIGRSIKSKRFKNSDGLPKKRTLWNIHNAKRHHAVVVTEASFDAMRVWQATGIEAVATLGSSFSQEQADQLNKYFTHVIIMTDDDQELVEKSNCRACRDRGYAECVGHNTGFELGMKIAESCRGIVVTWAHLDSLKRFDGNKDAGDLTDKQIKYAVDNAVSHTEISRAVFA